jgi:hypothetical protein
VSRKRPTRELRELLSRPEAEGWEADFTKGDQIRLLHPKAKGPVFMSLTPSDWRAMKNVLRDMKHALEGAR